MKSKKVILSLATLLLLGSGTFIYLFCGPYRFVDRPLDDQSLQHLRTGGGGAAWAASPSGAAFE